jgi:crossover junction endodeoxyribonuclease RusA
MKPAVNPFKGSTSWGANSKAAAAGAKRARARSRPRPAPRGVDDLPGLIAADLTAGQSIVGQVILPFPPVELSPNWRGHWSAHSAAAREYRRMCWALALEAKLRVPDYAGEGSPIHVRLDFFPPNRARRDDDNVPASFKAGRDGVADALRCDDARFRTRTVMHDEPRSCVVFSLIRPAEGEMA